MCKHNISPYLIIRDDIYNDIYDDFSINGDYSYFNSYDDDEYDECNECAKEGIREDIRFNLLIEEIFNIYLNIDIEETSNDNLVVKNVNLVAKKNNKKSKKFNLLKKIKKIIKVSTYV